MIEPTIDPAVSPVTPSVALPPVARKDRKETTIHGHTLVDDYSWLREKESAEVIAYLHAENDYANAWMEPTGDLRKTLYDEMVSHIKETDESVPFRDGDYFYYSRTEQGRQYPIYCRKFRSVDAKESIVLDVNALAADQAFMAVSAMEVSDDGRLLAFATDNTGFRQYTLHVKNLDTGELMAEQAERVGSIAWATDNNTLFFTVEDEEQKRQFQLYRHAIGTAHTQDQIVYQEDDERFNIGVGRTRDEKYLVMEASSHTASEQRFVAADSPLGEWTLVAPREDDLEYYVDHRHGLFYIRSNDKGRNFRLVTAAVTNPGKAHWVEVLPHRADTMLEEVDLFESFYVACERTNGLPHLLVANFIGEGGDVTNTREISFPEPVYNAHPHTNAEFDVKKYRYGYTSLITPGSVYEYDLESGESTLLKQQEVPGGFDRALYATERIFAVAEDAVQVPVSVVYRKDLKGQGTNPLYIYGYGSYGYSLPVGFSASRLSLLDRGVVLAYAHIRGGGDMGKPWHDAGRLMVKLNTFTDFIAATEHLVTKRYGDRNRIAIEGGSAGGLLMGGVVNLRPDLFRAVLSHVPFVDVMNTMLDPTLPLTVPEYEEWGNPNEQAAFEYMLSYSPYDQLKAGAYPAMLVKTSLNDSQVMYWEPAKYVARLRTLKTDDRVLLLETNMSAGHGGASGRYDYLKEIAFDYAFLLKELGVV